VKEILLSLALNEGYVTDESDFSWKGDAAEAWDADSTNFGEASMKDAYNYVTELTDERKDFLDEEGQQEGKGQS